MTTHVKVKPRGGASNSDQVVAVRPSAPRVKRAVKVAPAGVFTATTNVRMMHFLERVAHAFNESHVPLMALKGAALNLALFQRPHERPMVDLDLLIQPHDLDRAIELLKELGCRRSQILMREDFFPRFYYEVEFTAGTIAPVTIDLHVRPLRPIQFLRYFPDNALWQRAQTARIGNATILIPSTEDMLIHLTAHSTVHGHSKRRWLDDIRRWVERYQTEMKWQLLLEAVAKWRLEGAVLDGIVQAQESLGCSFCPDWVVDRLSHHKSSWLHRLAIRHAPRDNTHPAAAVFVNVLCAPTWRFRLSYLWSVLTPDRTHMRQWYGHDHLGWLPVAHLLRWLGPVTARMPALLARLSKVRVKKYLDGRIGLFVTTDIKTGQAVVDRRRFSEKATKGGVADTTLAALDRGDQPNVAWVGEKLVAIKPIRAGRPVIVSAYEQ